MQASTELPQLRGVSSTSLLLPSRVFEAPRHDFAQDT
jgi:hypothetical protein